MLLFHDFEDRSQFFFSQFDLEYHLCLFARDEVAYWMSMRNRPPVQIDNVFRQSVSANIDGVVKRAETMACKIERDQVGFRLICRGIDHFKMLFVLRRSITII